MTVNRFKQIRYFVEKDQPYFGGTAPTLTELWEYILQLQEENQELKDQLEQRRQERDSI